MEFNFGDKPLKYQLPNGYKAISDAPKNVQVQNTNGKAAVAIKLANNAPQAIIIEVIFIFTYHSATNLS